MCEVAGFSRAGYYRFLNPAKPAPEDMDLRDEMQKIALEWPSYGSRRIARGTEGPRLGSQPQAGAAADAGRQSAVRGEAEVRGDDGLGARAEGLSESGGVAWS